MTAVATLGPRNQEVHRVRVGEIHMTQGPASVRTTLEAPAIIQAKPDEAVAIARRDDGTADGDLCRAAAMACQQFEHVAFLSQIQPVAAAQVFPSTAK